MSPSSTKVFIQVFFLGSTSLYKKRPLSDPIERYSIFNSFSIKISWSFPPHVHVIWIKDSGRISFYAFRQPFPLDILPLFSEVKSGSSSVSTIFTCAWGGTLIGWVSNKEFLTLYLPRKLRSPCVQTPLHSKALRVNGHDFGCQEASLALCLGSLAATS